MWDGDLEKAYRLQKFWMSSEPTVWDGDFHSGSAKTKFPSISSSEPTEWDGDLGLK